MTRYCLCGCGKPIREYRYPSQNARVKGYLPGHAAKPRYVPKPEEIPSGICECGCGQPTELATRTNQKRRHFKGYPKPYLHGHWKKPKGPDHYAFRGIQHWLGYVYEYAPDHPAAYKSGQRKGYVLQHRLVWERANGRLLQPDEVVHHINGVRDDNRPENLVAMTNSAHCAGHAAEHRNGITDETRRKLSEASKRSWAKRRARK